MSKRYPRGYVKVGFDTGRDTLTQQQFAEDADINTIVRRFGVTRSMPSGPEGGVYGDFTGISDYQSALDAVQRAQDGFMALDADVRLRYGNDPGRYLEYVSGLSDEELEAASRPAPVSAPDPAPAGPRSSPAPVPAAAVQPDVAVGAERHGSRRRRDA